jgi:hypothetical protein
MPEVVEVGAAPRGVHLTLPLACGAGRSEVVLEAAHGEWLFHCAAHRAARDGLLGFGEPAFARFVAGRLRDKHEDTLCLGTVIVELMDAGGRVVGRQEFGSEAFGTFAEARAVHLWLATEGREGARIGRIVYSVHAADGGDEVFPVLVPPLPHLAVNELAQRADPVADPDRAWAATFIAPEVLAGFARLEAATRTTGLETAGRIHTRLGFDRERRCFVRVLERFTASTDVTATATTVVSTPASWGEYLRSVPGDAPTTPSQVHTHPHLPRAADAATAAGAESGLGTDAEPVISVQDRVTHLTTFPNTLSVSVILSVYEKRTAVSVYGYGPDGLLREEPGWFRLQSEETH